MLDRISLSTGDERLTKEQEASTTTTARRLPSKSADHVLCHSSVSGRSHALSISTHHLILDSRHESDGNAADTKPVLRTRSDGTHHTSATAKGLDATEACGREGASDIVQQQQQQQQNHRRCVKTRETRHKQASPISGNTDSESETGSDSNLDVVFDITGIDDLPDAEHDGGARTGHPTSHVVEASDWDHMLCPYGVGSDRDREAAAALSGLSVERSRLWNASMLDLIANGVPTSSCIERAIKQGRFHLASTPLLDEPLIHYQERRQRAMRLGKIAARVEASRGAFLNATIRLYHDLVALDEAMAAMDVSNRRAVGDPT